VIVVPIGDLFSIAVIVDTEEVLLVIHSTGARYCVRLDVFCGGWPSPIHSAAAATVPRSEIGAIAIF